MDRLSVERRSWLMSRVKSRDTKPEASVRRMVFSLGYRYRLHDPKLPGKPDLTITRLRKAIFVHGCFWHGHRRCRYGKLPKSRTDFWSAKIAANRKRDQLTLRRLKAIGWESIVIWQCELKRPTVLLKKIHDFLQKSK